MDRYPYLGILYYLTSVYLGKIGSIHISLHILYLHNIKTPIKGVEGGHFGVKKTLERIKRAFIWKKMCKEVSTFVAECEVCQRNKDENVSYP